jgi:hypothetical protein
MKVHKFAVAGAVSACAMCGGGAALAASAPTSGKIRVFATVQTPTKDEILFTGAIADYGTAISQDANGRVDPNGNFEKVSLKQGGFVIDSTPLQKALQEQFSKEKINPDNCSLAFTGTGPSTIENGTGAYAGISGKVMITLTVAGIAPRTPKGGCDLGQNASFAGEYQGVTAAGSVTVK